MQGQHSYTAHYQQHEKLLLTDTQNPRLDAEPRNVCSRQGSKYTAMHRDFRTFTGKRHKRSNKPLTENDASFNCKISTSVVQT